MEPAHGDDMFPPAHQISFHRSNSAGTKTDITWFDTASHGVETSPLWLITAWLRLMEPAAPSDYRVPPPNHEFSMPLRLRQPGDENRHPPVYKAPQGMETSSLLAYLWLTGSRSQGATRVAPPDNVKVQPHPGTTIFHPLIQNYSINPQFQQAGHENGHPSG